MVKISLKTYRNQIWHFFTILGFVAFGVIVGFAVIFPVMKNISQNTFTQFETIGKNIAGASKFNSDKFIKSLVDQFKAMDWSNPIKTLQDIFIENNFIKIIVKALQAGDCNIEQIKANIVPITNLSTAFINDSIFQFVWFTIIVIICASIGFVLIRTIIQMDSTKDYNIIKYIISLVLNIMLYVLFGYLLIQSINHVKSPGLYFLIFGMIILYCVCALFFSFITYGSKDIKLKEVINIKTILSALLSDVIGITISAIIVIVISIFSDIAAILIGIPLMLITTIIIDSTTNAYVSEMRRRKNVERVSIR